MASTSSTGRQSEIINVFSEIAPPSASTSVSATSSRPSQKRSWDVFLNHRGPDVKHTLARAIYHALHATGLRVFLDSEETRLGDFLPTALEQAMRSASLHVAIFSPTYAESPWCLAELSFMLKSGATIVPVFYHVQPSDLRWVTQGKGVYTEAFLKHQENGRYSLEKIDEWKRALHSVSFFKGEIIDNIDEEQMMLKTIVNHILKVMQIVPLEVAKHPVGLQELVEDFEMIANKCAEIQSGVQIVGVWGMGGSGKTTLAKELYNQKYLSVEKFSFIFDIRDAAAKNELYKKQIELLRDIGFQGEVFENIEKGKSILSNHLKSNRVLIILDDVDHIDQLDALLPTKNNLGLGSLIIVTTREKDVLRCWGISSIYKMKAMNLSNAKQLFCWHAFLQPFPRLGFEKLVEMFSSFCNGLPLSLKVLGGQLYGCSDKDVWRDLLNKISKILPLDIKTCLRVSYEALDVQEKQIFLDIACFLIGKDNRSAIAVWEESGWNGLYGWNRLVNKCFVDLDDANRITMHDHLRDLGREIANTQSPFRLWSPDQITGIQKLLEERVQIRGMILIAETNDALKFPSSLFDVSTGLSRFRWWHRRPLFRLGLKILVVREKCLNKYTYKLSKELAWFSCAKFDDKYLPSGLPLRNLRVLELENSDNLKELWKNGAEAPVQLRELSICGCRRFQTFPKSLGLLQHLRKIVVDHSVKLRSLPDEFCLLKSLEHLQLSNCDMLSSLPNNFGDLTDLQHLDLSSCMLTKVPISFKQLRLLQHLSIDRCYKLTLESDILEYITKLEYLNLSMLPELKCLPHNITNQVSLRELYIKDTGIRVLPSNIGQLRKLRVIKIGSCKIQFLPESMGRLNLLERLELQGLKVQYLPNSLTQLINLHIIKISNCPINVIPFGRKLFSSSFCKLKQINLAWTRVSKVFISTECCPNLLTLKLTHSEQLRKVQTLPTALKFIEVECCKILRNIKGIAGLSNLQTLKIEDCPELEAIPGLSKLTSLRKLELKECHKLSKIGRLPHCRLLEALLISECPELHSLPSFAGLVFLRVFELKGRNNVEKIEGLQHCKSLEMLVVEYSCCEVPVMESNLEHAQKLKLV
ncbi:disease resistance protein RPV1 [Cryptomeria japonica]|uniref:disease resistance protein RPV1 n=1 Tax=Cryptomeria japonica TaxID=3369 RepID=UPI0027DAB05E|nr:disease resistance protein RPV1 [Cryptomeria japonica]